MSEFEIVKVFDHDCDVCKKTASFDEKVAQEALGISTLQVVELDILCNPDAHTDSQVLQSYVLVERYALNPDYTIDLPVYLVTKKGKYVGHVTGDVDESLLRAQLTGMKDGE